nr:MAG TPA: hypothetical protein [Caudoviricetes sp.]
MSKGCQNIPKATYLRTFACIYSLIRNAQVACSSHVSSSIK